VRRRFSHFSVGQVIFAVTAVIVVYFLATFTVNFIRNQQLNEQESRLHDQVAEYQERYDRLKALEEYLGSDEYIETVAREELGLVKEGEIGFVAISTQPEPTPVPGEPRLWWEVLIR
jgi:cell division protein DivIC